MKKVMLLMVLFLSVFMYSCETGSDENIHVQFNTNGGTLLSVVTADFGTSISSPEEPVKKGYTFVNWYSDINLENEYDFNIKLGEDITLFAKWEINSYNISFNDVEGQILGEYVIEYGTDLKDFDYFDLNVPVGYRLECDKEVPDIMPNEDLDFICAHVLHQSTITFVTNSDIDLNPITQGKNTALILDYDLVKDEYVFNGWYLDENFENEFTGELMPEDDIVLYGKWKREQIYVGANIYSFNDNFMNGVIRPELERYSTEKGIYLEVVDSDGNQSTLNNQVDTFISKGVDVLVINLVNPAEAKTIIEKAKAANIPLILFNKEAIEAGIMDTYDKVWYVGTDISFAGKTQGKMMVADWLVNPSWDKNSDGILDYVLLKGEPGHPDAEARTLEAVKAFVDAGISVNELAIQVSATWSTSDANNTMETWLTGTFADDIEIVICNNDGMAFGAIHAMEAANNFIPIYGIDALAEALSKIGDGKMTGTVLNDGVMQARATIDLAINAANGVDVTEGTSWVLDSPTGTKAVRVAYVAVNSENYDDYQ